MRATAVPTRTDTNLTILRSDRDEERPRNCETIPDPDVMYPDSEERIDGRGRRNLALEAAKAVCSDCWFRVRCVEEAIDRREMFGIWGGLTLRERENLRRKRYSKSSQRAVEQQLETLFDVELVG